MEEMTWQEVRGAAAEGLPVVLPVGSTEQHGPHLPLNTDCVIPQAIALAPVSTTRWSSRRRSATAPNRVR